LLLGFCAAKSAGSELLLALSDSMYGTVSPIRLLLTCIIPFAVLLVAVFLSEYWLIPLICLYKAFTFGFCGYGIGLMFGQASWLVRVLFMFSDCMTIPVLLFFCLTVRNFSQKSFYRLLIGIAIFAIAIAVLEYVYIAPLFRAALS